MHAESGRATRARQVAALISAMAFASSVALVACADDGDGGQPQLTPTTLDITTMSTPSNVDTSITPYTEPTNPQPNTNVETTATTGTTIPLPTFVTPTNTSTTLATTLPEPTTTTVAPTRGETPTRSGESP